MTIFQKTIIFLLFLFGLFIAIRVYNGLIDIFSIKFFNMIGIFIGGIILAIYLKEIAYILNIFIILCFILTIIFLVTDVIYDNNIGWGIHQLFSLIDKDIKPITTFISAIFVEMVLFYVFYMLGLTKSELLEIKRESERVEREAAERERAKREITEIIESKIMASEKIESKLIGNLENEKLNEPSINKPPLIKGKKKYSSCPNCGNSSNKKEGIYLPYVSQCENCRIIFCSKCCKKSTFFKSAICPSCGGGSTRDVGRIG